MSGSELTELLDQVEGAIRDFSEELVQQLARRDELEFEKEVKNSFITVLIEVQNKQKEQRELMKKRRKEKGLSLQSSRIEKGNQMPLKVREARPAGRGVAPGLRSLLCLAPVPSLRRTRKQTWTAQGL